MAKTSTADRTCLRNQFAAARATLLASADSPQLDRSLSYWALPADRRLPVALLDRPLRDIVQTPFDRLAATPGIGQKKLGTLVLLMERAIDTYSGQSTTPLAEGVSDRPAAGPAERADFGTLGVLADDGEGNETGAEVSPSNADATTAYDELSIRPSATERVGAGASSLGTASEFSQVASAESESFLDPDRISETQWNQWCETTRRQGLEREKLGRLAPTLQELPNVIWDTPLGEYSTLSLAQVRRLRTHGEKRVRVVLEVFRSLHLLLGGMGRCTGLSVRLSPSFVLPLEEWFCEMTLRTTPLAWHELRSNLVLPLLNQLSFDAGPLVQKLAEGRLGVEGSPETVRVLAERVGVTRARVYQLLETCQRVMSVRWPEGRLHFDLLAARLAEWPIDPETSQLYQATRELFFPQRKPADQAGADRPRSSSHRTNSGIKPAQTAASEGVAASELRDAP